MSTPISAMVPRGAPVLPTPGISSGLGHLVRERGDRLIDPTRSDPRSGRSSAPVRSSSIIGQQGSRGGHGSARSAPPAGRFSCRAHGPPGQVRAGPRSGAGCPNPVLVRLWAISRTVVRPSGTHRPARAKAVPFPLRTCRPGTGQGRTPGRAAHHRFHQAARRRVGSGHMLVGAQLHQVAGQGRSSRSFSRGINVVVRDLTLV